MVKKLLVDVAIPVYNEEAELEKSVTTLVSYLNRFLTHFNWRVTIADNASTDRTLEIAKKLARNSARIKYIHLDQKGRGRAVKRVWVESDADILAYMDVDLSTDLKHFPALIQSLTRGYDIAIGSRNARGARVYGRNLIRTVTSKGYIVLIKLLFWVHFSDAQCGFKAVTKEIVSKLIPRVLDNAWFFDTELLLIAEKSGFRIYDEPVTWIDNPGSTVRVIKTAQGDLHGLWRMFTTRPWLAVKRYG